MGKLNILISVTTLTFVSILAWKSFFAAPSATAALDQYQTSTHQSSTQVTSSPSSEELQRLRRQILELTDQVQNLSLQLANSNTVTDTPTTLSSEMEEADALGEEFVNQMIALGAIEGEDKILLSQYLGKMSPEGQQQLTQKIARAVNERQLRFDPSSMQ